MVPANGNVVVNGTTSGCASWRSTCWAFGYRVTAVTGKASEQSYLESIGAAEVLAATY